MIKEEELVVLKLCHQVKEEMLNSFLLGFSFVRNCLDVLVG